MKTKGSFQMSPRQSLAYLVDQHLGDVEHRSDCPLGFQSRRKERTDFLNLAFGEFSPWAGLSSQEFLWMSARSVPISVRKAFRLELGPMPYPRGIPTFPPHVIEVILSVSLEKVSPIATDRIVAMVQDPQRMRVLSVVEKVRQPMSPSHYAGSSSGKTEPPVPTCHGACRPRPAFIWSTAVHLRPEPGDVFLGKMGEWFTIVIGHLASSIGLLLSALCGVTHTGPFSIVPQAVPDAE